MDEKEKGEYLDLEVVLGRPVDLVEGLLTRLRDGGQSLHRELPLRGLDACLNCFYGFSPLGWRKRGKAGVPAAGREQKAG